MSCNASAHHIHTLAKPPARSCQASAALLAGAGHSTSDSISVLAIETMSPTTLVDDKDRAPHSLMLITTSFLFASCRTLNIRAVLPYSTAPRELSSYGAAVVLRPDGALPRHSDNAR